MSISVSRGVLEAATTDNVQVLAILACERFGATIAMCQGTILKIERSVISTTKPTFVGFLKTAIGFPVNDSIFFLGQSLAGQQFLALAAALVTIMGSFELANALRAMLVSSAADKTLIPTVTQLKDLLAALKPSCHQARFADEVVGWHAHIYS